MTAQSALTQLLQRKHTLDERQQLLEQAEHKQAERYQEEKDNQQANEQAIWSDEEKKKLADRRQAAKQAQEKRLLSQEMAEVTPKQQRSRLFLLSGLAIAVLFAVMIAWLGTWPVAVIGGVIIAGLSLWYSYHMRQTVPPSIKKRWQSLQQEDTDEYDNPEAVIEHIRSVELRQEDLQNKKAQIEEKLQDKYQAWQQAKEAVDEGLQALTACDEAIKQWCRTHHFPEYDNVDVLQSVFTEVEKAQQNIVTRDNARETYEQIKRQVEDFAAELRTLADGFSIQVTDFAAALREMQATVSQQEDKQKKREALNEKIAECDEQLDTLDRMLQSYQGANDALLAKAKVTDAEAFKRKGHAHQQSRTFNAEISEAEKMMAQRIHDDDWRQQVIQTIVATYYDEHDAYQG